MGSWNCTRRQIISQSSTKHGSNFASWWWLVFCRIISGHRKLFRSFPYASATMLHIEDANESANFWTKEGRTNLRNLKWSEERELCVRINRLRSLNELIVVQKIKVKCFINFTRAYSQHEVWRLMEGRSSFFLLRSRAWASLLSCTYRFIHSR